MCYLITDEKEKRGDEEQEEKTCAYKTELKRAIVISICDAEVTSATEAVDKEKLHSLSLRPL